MKAVHRQAVSPRSRWTRSVAVVMAAGLLAAGSLAVAAEDPAGGGNGAAPGKGASDKSASDKRAADKGAAAAGEQVTYARHIQPILKESCVQCHRAPPANANRGAGRPGGAGGAPGARPRGPAGGLRLDDKAAVLRGGKHGKAIVPGKGEDSLLYRVLREPVTIDGEEIHAMPKARPNQDFTPIADEEIELIKTWIDQGAK